MMSEEELKSLEYVFSLAVCEAYSEEIDEISILQEKIIRILKENQKHKEEKRLILKDIKEWINCAKNEKLEDNCIHEQYWDMFETILNKIFKKYNTENLTEDDLKFNHYLEKENNKLILENKKYKEIIKKTINEIENGFFFDGDERFTYLETWMGAENILDILKEVEYD